MSQPGAIYFRPKLLPQSILSTRLELETSKIPSSPYNAGGIGFHLQSHGREGAIAQVA